MTLSPELLADLDRLAGQLQLPHFPNNAHQGYTDD